MCPFDLAAEVVDAGPRMVVLIADACQGGGPATARRLAAEGHHVVLGGRRRARLHALTREIRLAGGSAEWYALDLARGEEMDGFIAFAEDVHKRVDLVIREICQAM